MKTVIHAWTHKFNINNDELSKYNYLNESNFYFGLGDLIRSTIKLHELSKIMNFNYIVDIQLHPISQFLKLMSHKYTEYVYMNRDNIQYVCYGEVEDYINKHNPNDIMLILTNDFYENTIVTNDCKQFIKHIFTPTNMFDDFIQNKLSKIPFTYFNILHYRLNDNVFLNRLQDKSYDSYVDHIQTHKEHNDILHLFSYKTGVLNEKRCKKSKTR